MVFFLTVLPTFAIDTFVSNRYARCFGTTLDESRRSSAALALEIGNIL